MYLSFVVDTVIPRVLAKFQLSANPAGIAIMGYSYGGLNAFYAGYASPVQNTFSHIYAGTSCLK